MVSLEPLFPIAIVFLSTFWELFRLQGTALRRSTAYHPQTDGQTEVVNRTLETYLRCFASTRPKQWVRWLPWSEYWYNTSFHTSTQTTPFKAVYGRDPPPLVRYEKGDTSNAAVDQQLQDRDAALEELKLQLQRAQQRMVKSANKHRPINTVSHQWLRNEMKNSHRVFLALSQFWKKLVRWPIG